jgi:hypothetical protein
MSKQAARNLARSHDRRACRGTIGITFGRICNDGDAVFLTT